MVKQYEPSCMHSNLYEEHGQGMFVLHEDYEKLLTLAKKLARMVEYDMGADAEDAALAELEELLRD